MVFILLPSAENVVISSIINKQQVLKILAVHVNLLPIKSQIFSYCVRVAIDSLKQCLYLSVPQINSRMYITVILTVVVRLSTKSCHLMC